MRLQQKVVLVTAATRGIGLACVKACAREGAQVYLAARDLSRADEVAEQLTREGGTIRTVFLDASMPDTFSSRVEVVV